MYLVQFVLFLSFVSHSIAGPRVPESEWKPLDEYVWRPDDTYSWSEFREERIDDEGDTVYFLNLTSQTWMTPEFSNWAVWWHNMVVIVPEQLRYPDAAFVFIHGGKNTDPIPTPENEIITEVMRVLAEEVGCIIIFLKDIPNQPIVFTDDYEPGKRRSEDTQIAYTWRLFLDDPNIPPEVVSRMPMTKAIVRALDASTELLSQERGLNIDKFVLGGGSKRGWTTWTTAAVDDRVIGQIPMVMSLLNIPASVQKHYRSLGGWSFAFAPYHRENITLEFDNPEAQKLWDIEDCYTYMDRFTMPTMVVAGTSDQFFLLDDSHLFYDDIPGQRMMFMQPGIGHSLAPWVDTYANLRAFIAGVMTNYEFPQPTWDIEFDEFGCTLTMRTDGAITHVAAYYAKTEDGIRRDFRLNRAGGEFNDVEWFEDTDVQQVENETYRVRYDNPDPGTGWLAFFIEVSYDGPAGYELTLTSEVAITPDTYPFEGCQGDGCYGTLV